MIREITKTRKINGVTVLEEHYICCRKCGKVLAKNNHKTKCLRCEREGKEKMKKRWNRAKNFAGKGALFLTSMAVTLPKIVDNIDKLSKNDMNNQ